MNKTVLLILIIFSSCRTEKKESNANRLNVVTTTGMLYDAVVNITKDSANVDFIMEPGVDPHLYKATQGDLRKLDDADLIIYNGLNLEGKMGNILEKMGKIKSVIAAAEAIPDDKLLSAVGYQNTSDPHVWFDISLWKIVVGEVCKSLINADSKNASFYEKNLSNFFQMLDSMEIWVKTEISSIPEKNRILVTAHDAFQYFGNAYKIRVEGLQGLSTVTEPGLRDIARTIDLIIENDLNSVFVETSVSKQSINAVIVGCREKGHEVAIGGSLFSDAMGAINTPEGTYLGMVSSNVRTIVYGLK